MHPGVWRKSHLPKRSRSFLERAPKRSHPTFLYGNQWFRVTPSLLASGVYAPLMCDIYNEKPFAKSTKSRIGTRSIDILCGEDDEMGYLIESFYDEPAFVLDLLR